MCYEADHRNRFRKALGDIPLKRETVPVPLLRYAPFYHRLSGNTLFHSSYYRVSLQKNVANITTVYDFTYEHYRRNPARFLHRSQKGFALKHSSGIICISEHTRRDLLAFFPHLSPESIRVIHLGIGSEFAPLEDKASLIEGWLPESTRRKFLLFVGDRRYYKNFHTVIRALREAREFQLVFVGGGPLVRSERKLLSTLGERVIHLQQIDNARLNLLYNHAFCLVYPSAYEGFGFPVLEAMRAGCPVIAANSSSLPEVAGDAALFLEPIEVRALVQQIGRLEDPELRRQMIQKGLKRAELFSWDRCFQQTIQFYEEIYRKEFG